MNTKMRIALMTYAIDGRRAKGTALVARKCVLELLKRKDELDLTFIHYEKTDDAMYREGVREVLFPELWPRFLNRRSLRQIYYFFTTKDRYDVVQWFQPRLYPFFWFAPATHIVVNLHGAGDITAPRAFFDIPRAVFNFVIKYFSTYITAAIAVSYAARDEIVAHYKIPPEKVHVIYNGGGEDFVPIVKEEAFRVAEAYGIDRPFVLAVSRLQPHKNLARLIDAYTRARQSGIHQLLVIVGESAGAEKELYAQAKRSPHADDIRFISYVREEDLNALYSAADLFVYPSLDEGFGLPVIEAFASGTPVVSSNIPALKEVGGGAALLVDPHSTESIAKGIREALGADTPKKLIDKGLARASFFTWEKAGNNLFALYAKL